MSRVDRRPDDLMWTSKPTVITNQRIYISDDLDDIESWIPVRNHSHEHRTLRPETRWVFNFTLILNISLFVLWKMSLSTLIVDNIHCRVSIHLLSVYDSQWLADLCFCRKHMMTSPCCADLKACMVHWTTIGTVSLSLTCLLLISNEMRNVNQSVQVFLGDQRNHPATYATIMLRLITLIRWWFR